MSRANRLVDRVAAPALVLLAFALPLAFSTRKSVTIDEVVHIPAGYSYLRTGEIVLNPMHPPLVKELAALPLLFMDVEMPADARTIRDLGQDVTYQWEFGRLFFSSADASRIAFSARIAAAVLSLALAALVFMWARELWGSTGGLLALFLYVFDPTITAHAQLVTTDVGFALFAALFVFLLRRYVLEPSNRSLIPAGIALGLALGTKFSGVVLLPLALVLVSLAAFRVPAAERLDQGLRLVSGVVFMSGIAALVLWAVYLFPSDLSFYARGVEAVRADHDPHYFHYLMGQFRTGSWPHYFLVAWLVKTPIPAILTVFLAGWLLLRGRRSIWLDEAFVLLPAAALFAGYSLRADPIGVRYIIPCYPFLFVFSARVGPRLASLGRRGGAIAAVLGLWYVIEFVTVAPDHLSYFNQLAGGPEGGLDWLDDSNVDWGQGLIQLRDYTRQHAVEHYRLCAPTRLEPANYAVHGQPIWIGDLLSPPEPGTLILSGHCVARARAALALRYGDGSGNWLATVQPKAIVGHAYYIYEIPEQPAG